MALGLRLAGKKALNDGRPPQQPEDDLLATEPWGEAGTVIRVVCP